MHWKVFKHERHVFLLQGDIGYDGWGLREE
jgi:hypothetical protein